MMAYRKSLAILFAAALLSSPTSIAQTLPLPETLVAAASDAGEALLVDADAREAYFPRGYIVVAKN